MSHNINIDNIIKTDNWDAGILTALLEDDSQENMDILRDKAYQCLKENIGEKIFTRGLVEFSNICSADCCYCGIRKSSKNVDRFMVDKESIVNAAVNCAKIGYGSFVMQSGERKDEAFIDFVVETLKEIKEKTVSDLLPEGLGITLSVGEHSLETYKRFFEAGAHRYLLRIETTNKELFSKIHPPEQTFENRLNSLRSIQEAGMQTGTGVMIGLPGQTFEDLANDILFFRTLDIDMIGMGPYVIDKDTPMAVHTEFWKQNREKIFWLALRMIALTRLTLKDVNIASTTALETIGYEGKRHGLSFGANVIMPVLTPEGARQKYNLYNEKPKGDVFAKECITFDDGKMTLFGREIAVNEWGDPKHFAARKGRKGNAVVS